jgi:ferrous iron transport protein B
MEDEAKARGIEIDYGKLGSLLHIEVVGTIAPQKKGIQRLREAILDPRHPPIHANYNSVIEEYIGKISDRLPEANISKRSIALMILSGDESLKDWLMTNINTEEIKRIEDLRDEAQTRLKEPISSLISHARIKLAEDITGKVQKNTTGQTGALAQGLSKWSMHPVLGIPILLLVIIGFYEFVGKFGAGVLVDFFEEVIFGTYLNPMIEKTIKFLIPLPFIQEIFIGRYGIFTMALTYALGIILPITTTFFLAFGFLEDSGYLPRLAVVSDKLFRLLGLNGKAVLPMILGLGCGTYVVNKILKQTEKDYLNISQALAIPVPHSLELCSACWEPLPYGLRYGGPVAYCWFLFFQVISRRGWSPEKNPISL